MDHRQMYFLSTSQIKLNVRISPQSVGTSEWRRLPYLAVLFVKHHIKNDNINDYIVKKNKNSK